MHRRRLQLVANEANSKAASDNDMKAKARPNGVRGRRCHRQPPPSPSALGGELPFGALPRPTWPPTPERPPPQNLGRHNHDHGRSLRRPSRWQPQA